MNDLVIYPQRLHQTPFGWITEIQTPKGTWLPCRCPSCRDIFLKARRAQRDQRLRSPVMDSAHAAEYVASNPEQFDDLRARTREELVAAVSERRAAGDIDEEQRICTFLMATHEPQQISGEMLAEVKLPGFG